tara:strand:- start:3547 stop:3708 length:162 start_codon:yes stop_codon:yes gene_type:complete
MIKNITIQLLKGLELEFGRRCEISSSEEDRDTYAKWFDQVKKMRLSLQKGSVK